MQFTLIFVKLFFVGLALTAPILLFLSVIIVLLGQVVGRRESWSSFDALYSTFVTATTVGYGDFRPLDGASRVLSILIAISGIVFTGIIVAVAISATTEAIKLQVDPEEFKRIAEEIQQ